MLERIPKMRVLIVLLFFSTLALSFRIHSHLHFPFPQFTQLIFDIARDFETQTSMERPLGSEGGFRDFAGLLLGMRRLTADIAWISVLQYYGGGERKGKEGAHHHSDDFTAGRYFSLKKMVLRVVRLDPSLHYAYLYGSSALAFGLDRPKEALEILEEGIKHNPTFWRLRLYLSAIIYKQAGKFDDMLVLLEDATRYPDCPTMVKSILANTYKERKNYRSALKVWIEVLESGNADAWYTFQAEQQIKDLKKKMGIPLK